MEKDGLDGAFYLFEWGLRMSPRNLMDPDSALYPASGLKENMRIDK